MIASLINPRSLSLMLSIVGLSTFTQSSYGADSSAITCEIGNELAGRTFKRAATAKNAKNYVIANENRMAFWDVYQYSSHCENVKKMADELTSKGLGKDAKPPSSVEVASSFLAGPDLALPKSCWEEGSLRCRIIITDPPKGNAAGYTHAPSFYLLEGFGSGIGEPSSPNWKKFDQKKLMLPLTTEGKGK